MHKVCGAIFGCFWGLHNQVAIASTCESYDNPTNLVESDQMTVNESSGLAPSRITPGVYYTHNDSGSDGELFSFDLAGNMLGTHAVENASSIDWEDMAIGPCPENLAKRASNPNSCLYIGDIGDNPHERSSVTIHITDEPAPATEQADAPANLLASWSVTYDETNDETGKPDSEALLVHPTTGDVSLLTKSVDGITEVHRVPSGMAHKDTAAMSLISTLQLEGSTGFDLMVTGGDWDEDGERLIIRTYITALLWETDPCAPDSHWATAPTVLEWAIEQQGEAITFAGNLDPSLPGAIISTSEGTPMPINGAACSGFVMGKDSGCGDTAETATDSGPAIDTSGAGLEDGTDTPSQELTDDEQPSKTQGCSGCRSAALSLLFLPWFAFRCGWNKRMHAESKSLYDI